MSTLFQHTIITRVNTVNASSGPAAQMNKRFTIGRMLAALWLWVPNATRFWSQITNIWQLLTVEVKSFACYSVWKTLIYEKK